MVSGVFGEADEKGSEVCHRFISFNLQPIVTGNTHVIELIHGLIDRRDPSAVRTRWRVVFDDPNMVRIITTWKDCFLRRLRNSPVPIFGYLLEVVWSKLLHRRHFQPIEYCWRLRIDGVSSFHKPVEMARIRAG